MSLAFLAIALYLIGAGLTFLVALFVLTEPPETVWPWSLLVILTVGLVVLLWPVTVPALGLWWLVSEIKEKLNADD